MIFLLFLAVLILGILLFDTRGRLKRLEMRASEKDIGEKDFGKSDTAVSWQPAQPAARRSAIIVDRPAPPSVQVADEPQRMVDEPAIMAQEKADDTAPHADDLLAGEIIGAASVPVAAIASEDVPKVSAAKQPVAPTRAPAKDQRGTGQRFEDLFGRQLPIWAGGITLAVAGVLLVKYSIDAGLLSPLVRVFMGLMFGVGLIGGAEAALRGEARVGDPRVRQALSGAGIATLYAAILAAANLYALVGPVTAFAGLAIVTALAMALSVRFGAPSAILGLVGGLAAPALVGEGPPNVPLLSAYLALAIGGLTALSRRQKWMWLGISALVGGAGWGGILILTGALDFATSLSLGLLSLVLGIALPWFAFSGTKAGVLRMGAAVVAAMQIALLVAKGGFSPLVWGFYLLLAGALFWLAWREERFRPLPPVGLTIGLLLTAIWPEPPLVQFACVLLGLGAIHTVPAFARLWRTGGSMIEAGQIMGLAVAGYAVTWFHYHLPTGERNGCLALLALATAAVPALAAWLGWAESERREDARFAGLALVSALLVAVAAWIGLSMWLLPVAVAGVTAGLVLLGGAAADRRIEQGAMAFMGGAVLALLATSSPFNQIDRLFGEAGSGSIAQALLRWGAVALAAGLGACRLTVTGRSAVAVVASVLGYGIAAQVAPDWSLPIVASLGLIAMAEAGRRFTGLPWRAAQAGFAGIALLWAMGPFVDWLASALLSLLGEPMLVGDVPVPMDAVTCLAVPAVIGLLSLWRGGLPKRAWLCRSMVGLLALLGVAAAHSLYKQIFRLEDGAALIRLGLAERTLWEMLLLGGACAVWRWRGLPLVALAGAGAAVAHGLWYSQILLNPLVGEVAVGSWPVVNLLLPAFALLFMGLWVIERTVPVWQASVGRTIVVVRMILIPLFAYASLRQLFCGNLLVGTPVGGVESIGVSVLAIALAIGFLLWGIRSGRHDWRIGSLILMLAAVAKVFLLDAAGLEGLLRIASFLALGFSLIGIGWLYSRFLRSGGGEGQV